MPSRNVVIFSGKYASDSTVEHVEAIAETFPDWTFTVVQERPDRSWLSVARAKVRRIRQASISGVIESLVGLAGKLRWAPRQRSSRNSGHPHSLDRIRRDNIRYQSFPSLRTAEASQFIENLRPWLGICLSAPILKATLFSIPEMGTINLHKSLLPDYRGMPPGFWELHDGADESGVTIHRVEEGLDTGAVIEQKALRIGEYSTPAGLAAELDLLGSEALVSALEMLDSGTARERPQPSPTRPANRQPPWLLALRVRRRCKRARLPVHGNRWVGAVKGIVKVAVQLAFVHGWARLRNAMHSRMGRCHTTVLLYHRVSDHFLDPVTVGVEQFKQHLSLLAKHYDVLDLPTFLATHGAPRKRPAVVITFDDGYEDNLLAAQLARRADLPCTFFVATRIVGSQNAFPHDLERLGRRVPTLEWHQIRRMARWGFTIGNHTAHHVNLGQVTPVDAETEIQLAQQDLGRELGAHGTVPCLAYPYGKKDDITKPVIDRLPSCSISHCLSAYGGTNPPDFDPWDIRRAGVDYNFSPLSLRARVEGWMPRASARDWAKTERTSVKSQSEVEYACDVEP